MFLLVGIDVYAVGVHKNTVVFLNGASHAFKEEQLQKIDSNYDVRPYIDESVTEIQRPRRTFYGTARFKLYNREK